MIPDDTKYEMIYSNALRGLHGSLPKNKISFKQIEDIEHIKYKMELLGLPVLELSNTAIRVIKNDDLMILSTKPILICKGNFGSLFSNLNIATVDASNTYVESVQCLFKRCRASSIIVDNLKVLDNEKSAFEMFCGCDNLTKIHLGNVDLSQVTDMEAMFMNCTNLEEIDFGDTAIHNIINLINTFCGCRSLKKIKMNNIKVANNEKIIADDMLLYATELERIDIPKIKVEVFNNYRTGLRPSNALKIKGKDGLKVFNYT